MSAQAMWLYCQTIPRQWACPLRQCGCTVRLPPGSGRVRSGNVVLLSDYPQAVGVSAQAMWFYCQTTPRQWACPLRQCGSTVRLPPGSGRVRSGNVVLLSDYPQAVGVSAQAMWFYCQTTPRQWACPLRQCGSTVRLPPGSGRVRSGNVVLLSDYPQAVGVSAQAMWLYCQTIPRQWACLLRQCGSTVRLPPGSGRVCSGNVVLLSDYPQAVGVSAQAMWFYCQTTPRQWACLLRQCGSTVRLPPGSGRVRSGNVVVLSDYPQAVGVSAQAMWFYCQTTPRPVTLFEGLYLL